MITKFEHIEYYTAACPISNPISGEIPNQAYSVVSFKTGITGVGVGVSRISKGEAYITAYNMATGDYFSKIPSECSYQVVVTFTGLCSDGTTTVTGIGTGSISYNLPTAYQSALIIASGAAFSLCPAPSPGPELIFEDNFNTENGGVFSPDYNSFTKWTVPTNIIFPFTQNRVDLLDSSTAGLESLSSQGLFVDLLGSQGGAFDGKLQSIAIPFILGEDYSLKFKVCGIHHPLINKTLNINIGSSYTGTYNVVANTPFTLVTIDFTSTATENSNIIFSQVNAGGASIDRGSLIDDIELYKV